MESDASDATTGITGLTFPRDTSSSFGFERAYLWILRRSRRRDLPVVFEARDDVIGEDQRFGRSILFVYFVEINSKGVA